MSELVYGIHAVEALLKNPHRCIRMLYVREERSDQKIQEILKRANQQAIHIERLSISDINKKFPAQVHQGVVAIAHALPEYVEADLPTLLKTIKEPGLILILDGITDPHNLGACLRSADAAGVNFVIIPKDKNVGITPVVNKVACGATESTPLVRVTNLARSMELLKQAGVWIYGAAGEAEQSIYDYDFKNSVALVMGAEDKGMRRLTKELCDGLFALPMLGAVSSLNVSVATGISLYEVIRQRRV